MRTTVLVAGDRGRGDDHGVAGLDLDVRWSRFAMRARPAVGSPWLPVVTMASLSGVVLDAGPGDDLRGRRSGSRARVAIWTLCSIVRPVTNTLRPHVRGGVEHLLDARDERRERRDDDAAFGGSHDLAERLADDLLGRRVAGPLGVGGVGQRQQTPSSPSSGEAREVRRAGPSTGVWSSLKSPVWTTVPTGVRIAMPIASGMLWRDPERLDVERADVDGVARVSSARTGSCGAVLLELHADEAVRERRCVDGHVDLAEDVRQRADVVLVAVRDEDAP